MKRILLVVLCLAMLWGTAGCGTDLAPQNPQEQPIAGTRPTQSTTAAPTLPQVTEPPQYLIDQTVNQYVLDFEKQTRYTLAGMSQNADLSCSAYIDVCKVTIRSTQYGLYISLTGGHTKEDRDRMLDVFYTMAQVADPSCSDNRMESALIYLKAQKKAIANHEVSDTITVTTYVPVINDDTVKVPCRMEFIASNRKATQK